MASYIQAKGKTKQAKGKTKKLSSFMGQRKSSD
jgi:hypothetical protein